MPSQSLDGEGGEVKQLLAGLYTPSLLAREQDLDNFDGVKSQPPAIEWHIVPKVRD